MKNSWNVKDILQIAREAGYAILKIYAVFNAPGANENDIVLPVKSDASPLTKADLASHDVIVSRLKILTPDIPVVSEEDQQSWSFRQPDNTFWLVDPLDGTKEFLARSGEFTVNIALVKNGAAVFGIIYAPVLNAMYWGGEGIGAFRDIDGHKEPIHVCRQPVETPTHVRIVASKSHLNAKTKEFIASLFSSYTLVQAGSSLKFCRIAEGSADIYPRLGPTCEWDTAAGQAIVEAAGGKVMQLDGKVLTYGKTDILNPFFVASTVPCNH